MYMYVLLYMTCKRTWQCTIAREIHVGRMCRGNKCIFYFFKKLYDAESLRLISALKCWFTQRYALLKLTKFMKFRRFLEARSQDNKSRALRALSPLKALRSILILLRSEFSRCWIKGEYFFKYIFRFRLTFL